LKTKGFLRRGSWSWMGSKTPWYLGIKLWLLPRLLGGVFYWQKSCDPFVSTIARVLGRCGKGL